MATVGSAPLGSAAAGARIKDVDREDIINELRGEADAKNSSGKMRERRKTLRETAKGLYAEAIEIEASELNEAELQDIDNVVNYLLDPERKNGGAATRLPPAGCITTATVATHTLVPVQAPALVPMQATTLVQPMVPVQLLVPVQPKHHLFHHK